MKLPFGYRIVKQRVTETHIRITLAVDPKDVARALREELHAQSRRSGIQTRGEGDRRSAWTGGEGDRRGRLS